MTLLCNEEQAREFVAARCTAADFVRIERFVARLSEANGSQNLVSGGSLAAVWLRHVADSVQLLDHVPRETGPWLDIGTGAGFPGLALALLDPDRKFILVESRKLRIQWLTDVIRMLGARNCTVLGTSAERVETFAADVISARALAPLDRLIALSERFSTASTHWVLPKGRSAAQEVAKLPLAQRSLFHVKQSLTDPEAGIIVGLGKVEIAA